MNMNTVSVKFCLFVYETINGRLAYEYLFRTVLIPTDYVLNSLRIVCIPNPNNTLKTLSNTLVSPCGTNCNFCYPKCKLPFTNRIHSYCLGSLTIIITEKNSEILACDNFQLMTCQNLTIVFWVQLMLI